MGKNILAITGAIAVIAVSVGLFMFRNSQANRTVQNEPLGAAKKTDQTVSIDPAEPIIKNSKKLDLSGRSLKKIPEDTFFKTDLEELDASHNLLTGAIQAEVRHLENLRVLDLSDNDLTGVPAEVGQLKNLEILDLSNNSLTGLPYELGNLKKLKSLDLSGNDYSKNDLEVIKKTLPLDTLIITGP